MDFCAICYNKNRWSLIGVLEIMKKSAYKSCHSELRAEGEQTCKSARLCSPVKCEQLNSDVAIPLKNNEITTQTKVCS